MHAVTLRRFPKIKQKNINWCIFAAVENIVKFHGGNITQDDIFDYYTEKFHEVKDIDLKKIHDILENHFSHDFSYRLLNKRDSEIIGRAKDVIALIKSGVSHDIPPIILVNFPSCWYLPGYSTSCSHYVFIALGVSQNSVLIWDTNPKTINIPVVVENEWILNHLSPDLASFWIIPNEKLETFETLLKGVVA